MFGADIRAAGEVGHGAAHLEDAVVGAGAEAEAVHGLFEEGLAGGIDAADLAQLLAAHLGVAVDLLPFVPVLLDLPRDDDALAHVGALLRRAFGAQLGEWHGGHFDVDVDAVQQRATHLVEVFLHHTGRADAFLVGMVVVATRTRIHRRHEHETGRILHREPRAADGDHTILQGLAQDLQHLALELGQLVQEEHAVVRQADLAGLGEGSAAHERHIADGVVR